MASVVWSVALAEQEVSSVVARPWVQKMIPSRSVGLLR